MFEGPTEVNWMNVDYAPYIGKVIDGEKYGLGLIVC
jgi:hypothetical protein